jgi:hypothetical protein
MVDVRDERKRLFLLVFKDVVVDGEGIAELVPHDDWKPYMGAVLTRKQGLPERKTGVKCAEVITARLVQDERGWLRLAG